MYVSQLCEQDGLTISAYDKEGEPITIVVKYLKRHGNSSRINLGVDADSDCKIAPIKRPKAERSE